MTDSSGDHGSRIYLGSVVVMLVESNQLEADILAQVLTGFKVKRLIRCSTTAEAADRLRRDSPDLLVVGSAQSGTDGFEFIRTMRRDHDEIAAHGPGDPADRPHAAGRRAARAGLRRQFVVAKPITPPVLYERILWLIRDRRSFIYNDSYSGRTAGSRRPARPLASRAAARTTSR
ncbi:MAG: hypothetical protein WDN49_14040 [Acetobacteraceae bacterium]